MTDLEMDRCINGGCMKKVLIEVTGWGGGNAACPSLIN